MRRRCGWSSWAVQQRSPLALQRDAVQKRMTKKRTGTASDLPAMTVRQVMRAVEPEIDREVELEVEGL